MEDQSIIVRKGRFEDLSKVLELVVELAIYEEEPKAVTATLEEYQQLFKANWYDVYVAEKSNQIIGIAIYYRTFSTWKGKMYHLEDLVVSESYRKLGIGKRLFQAVLHEAKENNCALLKWQVLDWNTPAIKFYKSLEAIIEKEWLNGKIIIDKAKYHME